MLTAESAFAARKYGVAGCGLGSAVFGTGGMQTSAAKSFGPNWEFNLLGESINNTNALSAVVHSYF